VVVPAGRLIVTGMDGLRVDRLRYVPASSAGDVAAETGEPGA